MIEDKTLALQQKLRRLELERQFAMGELAEVKASGMWGTIVRYRGWLKRHRANGGAIWFRWYDNLTGRLLGYLPKAPEPFPSISDVPAKRFEAGNPTEWRAHFEALNRGVASLQPRISILTPAWNTRVSWFTEAAVSVLDQTIDEWEWIVVDDASKSTAYRPYAEALVAACPRFQHRMLEHNLGISGATNAALAAARGEYVCMLDHDDLLHPEALAACLRTLGDGKLDAVYSDSNKVSEAGVFDEPFYKPDWSPDFFRGVMFVGHLLCVRRDIATEIGGFDGSFNGIQDYEFMLRFSERTARIGHIPRILYHWRKAEGSLAVAHNAKDRIGELQQRAVGGHLGRLGLAAEAETGPWPHRVTIVPKARVTQPRVSVIIPTRDAPDVLAKCLDSIRSRSTYSNLQIVCADNETGDPMAIRKMREAGVDRVVCSGNFNYSRINNQAIRGIADGEYLILLNNDIEVITPDWVQEMLYYAEQADIGAVGAMLLFPDGRVQHAGVTLGFRGTADHILRGADPDSDGYAGSLSCAHEVSAVTAACLMVKRSLYEEVGGLNEFYRVLYQDVDFCLRLRALGKRNIFTPRARLFHHESYSRKADYDMVDRSLLIDCWEEQIKKDPYFNPNFSREHVDYQIARGADRGLSSHCIDYSPQPV